MAVDPTVESLVEFPNLAAAAAIKVGDLVYWDSTNLRLAKSNATDSTKPAEYVVVSGRAAANGDTVGVSKRAIFSDADLTLTLTSGFYQNPLYLHTTAGEFNQTKPTGAGNLEQVVGRPLSATRYEISLKDPYVHTLLMAYSGVTGTAGPQGTGADMGIGLLAINDAVHYAARTPQNAVKLLRAEVSYGDMGSAQIATGTTWSFTVDSGRNDDAYNAVTDSIAAAEVPALSALDDVGVLDISAAFNATNIIQPGRMLELRILKVAEAAVNQDPSVFCVMLSYLCV